MRETKPKESKDLSKKLKQLRESKGWSQGQLSKKTEIHILQISKYERGVSFPTVNVLIKLSKAFGITLDELILDEKRINLDQIDNPELLERFEQINNLESESQAALLTMMDALIMQHNIKQMANKPGPI